jgi:hypothetical protein
MDSAVTNILANVALLVLINGITSFDQYIVSPRKHKAAGGRLFQIQIVHLLLYSNVASHTPVTNKIFADRECVLMNKSGV